MFEQQHQHRASPPPHKLARAAGLTGSGAGGPGGTLEPLGGRVLRTSTAPPTVSALLGDMAAEEMGRLRGVTEHSEEAEAAGGRRLYWNDECMGNGWRSERWVRPIDAADLTLLLAHRRCPAPSVHCRRLPHAWRPDSAQPVS